MSIEWDKILNNPTKSFKVRGEELLEFRSKIESQDMKITDLTNARDELNSRIKTLEKNVSELQSKLKARDEKLESMTVEIDGLDEKLTQTKTDADSSVSELKIKYDGEIGTKDKVISELKASLSQKDNEISELKNNKSQLESKNSELESMKNNLEGKTSQNENEIIALKNQIDDLQSQINSKDAALKIKDAKIDEYNVKIEELKDQIPKKPIYEKAEEIIKGASCPNCGMETKEEYKIVDGKRELIRKYCPNVTCGWTFTETTGIAFSLDSPVTTAGLKELTIFQVKKGGVEKVNALASSMVAIVADPDQDIIWIWKGQDSDRFIYAEATSQANRVKNEVARMPLARIERIDEGDEPEKFPFKK